MQEIPISQAAGRRLGRLLIAGILALHIFFLWSIRGRIARGDPDFTIYFTAAKMLRQGLGKELYNPSAQYKAQQEFTTNTDIRRGPLPYIHPPFEALPFVPLTFLSYTAAFLVWNLINLGMLLAVCVLLRRSLGSIRRIPPADCFLACLAFFPIVANFHQGQDAILLLLIVVITFRALKRNADLSAGCWLAVALFKFQFVLPIAIILTLWRGRRFLAGFMVVASAALAVSIALVGWRGAMAYPGYAWQIISTVRLGGLPYRLMPNLTGLVNGWPILENLGWPMRIVTLAGSTGLLVLIAFMQKLARQTDLFNLCFACAVIVAVTISYNTNSYDLALLLVPAALLLDYCLRAAGSRRTFRVLFLPASPLLFSPLWFFLWMHWMRTNLMALSLLWWCFAIWSEAHWLGKENRELSSVLPQFQSKQSEAVT